MSIRVFMSYNNKDREMAGALKQNLEMFGFSVFLAHEDIEPSKDWRETILYELKSMDVFLPLLTYNYKESDWTDQEAGVAVDRDVLTIPLMVDIAPYGFLNRHQALKVDAEDIRGTCNKIVETIGGYNHLKGKLRESLIEGFGASKTFEEASMKAQYLLGLGPFDESEINVILRMAGQNNQIYGSFDARKKVEELIEMHKDNANPDLLKHFRRMAVTWDEEVWPGK